MNDLLKRVVDSIEKRKAEILDSADFLLKNPRFPLVVGIDNFLLKKDGRKDFLAAYEAVKSHIFTYSNYPGVEKVCRALDKVAAL